MGVSAVTAAGSRLSQSAARRRHGVFGDQLGEPAQGRGAACRTGEGGQDVGGGERPVGDADAVLPLPRTDLTEALSPSAVGYSPWGSMTTMLAALHPPRANPWSMEATQPSFRTRWTRPRPNVG